MDLKPGLVSASIKQREKTKWIVIDNQLVAIMIISLLFSIEEREDKHPSFDVKLIRFHYLIPIIITLMAW